MKTLRLHPKTSGFVIATLIDVVLKKSLDKSKLLTAIWQELKDENYLCYCFQVSLLEHLKCCMVAFIEIPSLRVPCFAQQKPLEAGAPRMLERLSPTEGLLKNSWTCSSRLAGSCAAYSFSGRCTCTGKVQCTAQAG